MRAHPEERLAGSCFEGPWACSGGNGAGKGGDPPPTLPSAGMADATPPRKKRRPTPNAGPAPIVPAAAVARLMHMGAAGRAASAVTPSAEFWGTGRLTIAPNRTYVGRRSGCRGSKRGSGSYGGEGGGSCARGWRQRASYCAALSGYSPGGFAQELFLEHLMDKAHEVSLHHSRTCIEYYDVGASAAVPPPAAAEQPTLQRSLTSSARSHGSRDERPLRLSQRAAAAANA